MTGLFTSRTGWLALGLVALTGIGLGVLSTRNTGPIAEPLAKTTACASCDARHARLTDLRGAQPEGTE